jgi:membrane protein YqaA with SNARE-associated domain
VSDEARPAPGSAPAETEATAHLSALEGPPPERRHLFRRMYDWVLSWADSRYGTLALAVISFAESSFFPIPPDVLQLALSVSKPRRSFYYASVSLVASVLGGVFGWLIGLALWDALSGFFFEHVPGFTEERFRWVEAQYQEHAFLTIFGAAFTPIPYKIFTIASGVFEVALPTVILASVLGRGMRFFSVALLIRIFGPKVKELIERYFELVALLLFAALVAGFAVLKYLL